MIVDFYISCIPQERLEWLAAILVELSEELYVLKPAGMDESAQYIDRHTEYVTEEADDDQCDRKPVPIIEPSRFTTLAMTPVARPSARSLA